MVRSYQGKNGKPYEIRGRNKESWGIPSAHRMYNRQKSYWCDFDQKENTVMRKEQMIKTPKSLVK